MEGKYIFAIIILGIFFVLILISLAFLELKRKSDARLQAWINERYANDDLNNFDYDTVSAEEELSNQSIREENNVQEIMTANKAVNATGFFIVNSKKDMRFSCFFIAVLLQYNHDKQ